MPTYQNGSQGPDVAKIQARLQELKLYPGPLDTLFSGAVETAVRLFQSQNSLPVDGMVGPATWPALFPAPCPIAGKPVNFRCLALTGSFETSCSPPDCFSGLTGDFDGQGMSFGALQWNLGQSTLQPLLLEMNRTHGDILKQIFAEQYGVLIDILQKPRAAQMAWARSIQSRRFVISDPWHTMLKALGATDEFQAIETEGAQKYFQNGLDLFQQYRLRTQRGAALMFDIAVQNGSISPKAGTQIMTDYAALDPAQDAAALEVARMVIVAQRCAQDCKPTAIEDVRRRKLAIANGTGTVHGKVYDLAAEYALTLAPAEWDR